MSTPKRYDVHTPQPIVPTVVAVPGYAHLHRRARANVAMTETLDQAHKADRRHRVSNGGSEFLRASRGAAHRAVASKESGKCIRD